MLNPQQKVLEFEVGLVQGYLNKARQFATKAIDGKDVSADIAELIDDAAKHFAVVKTSTELGNLRHFRAQLMLLQEGKHQPPYAAALKLAEDRVDAIVQDKEAPPPKIVS